MQILGDRHYRAEPGEQVTFSVGSTSHVGGVTASVDMGPGTTLPVTVSGGGHHSIVVTVGFTGDSDGSANILVRGSAGGTDESRIRQLDGLPFRNALFTVD